MWSVQRITNNILQGRRSIATVANDSTRRLFKITFNDGTEGLFPYVWLRDTSLDPSTYSISDSMKARRLFMRDFDVRVVPKSFSHDVESNSLKINWPGNVQSTYASSWLKSRNPSSPSVAQKRRKVYLNEGVPWDRAAIEQRLQKFDHTAVMTDDKALHDFLTAVTVDGIAILTNGPNHDKNVVDAIGDRIGLIHRTHFGTVFEVTTKVDASNMAYASGDELPYHTDFPSLSQPPELQMLHMYQRAVEGGLSMFVDGFKIAEIMRRDHRNAFKLLTETPLEYIEEGYDVHERNGTDFKFVFDMTARHRVIKLDEPSGKVIKIQFGNAMRAWFYDTDPTVIQEVYDALKLFTELCYAPENQLIFQLNNGETMLWSNTRLLHARSAYTVTPECNRSIFGCYFMWDIVKSRIRVIREQQKLPEDQPAL